MVLLVSVAAMLCKTLIDFLGSITGRRDGGRQVNLYYSLQSATMLVLLLLLWLTGLTRVQVSAPALFYSALTGLLSFVAYLLFLNSLKGENGTVNITVYRLNFIISSLLGILVLGETVTFRKVAGILLCTVAILIFIGMKDLLKGRIDIRFLYSLAASILTGILNMFNKMALTAGINSDTLLTFRYLVVMAMTVALFRVLNPGLDFRGLKTNRGILLPGAVSGALMLGSLFLLYYAMAIGEISVVIPIVQSCFIFTSLLCVLFLKEKMTMRKAAGVVLAVASMLVLSL